MGALARTITATLVAVMLAPSALGQAPPLKPELQGIGFLLGGWTTPTRGTLAETQGTSAGEMSFTPGAQGAVLLRKDKVRLFDAAGKPAGTFEIMMMIYSEGGNLHADYADAAHIIHYVSAKVDPGRSVTFFTQPSSAAPSFKLSFALVSPRVMDIAFSMAPPGGGEYRSIAAGSAAREP